MSAIRLWIAAAHDPAHRNGGWAFVCARPGAEVAGRAGGDRRTTRSRMALSGFMTALKDLPPGGALSIIAPRPDAVVLRSLLSPPADPDTHSDADDADLRRALSGLLTGRACTLALGDPAGPTPAAFAAAWADLASEKAKASGAFEHAIPRPNLAKMRGI